MVALTTRPRSSLWLTAFLWCLFKFDLITSFSYLPPAGSNVTGWFQQHSLATRHQKTTHVISKSLYFISPLKRVANHNCRSTFVSCSYFFFLVFQAQTHAISRRVFRIVSIKKGNPAAAWSEGSNDFALRSKFMAYSVLMFIYLFFSFSFFFYFC